MPFTNPNLNPALLAALNRTGNTISATDINPVLNIPQLDLLNPVIPTGVEEAAQEAYTLTSQQATADRINEQLVQSQANTGSTSNPSEFYNSLTNPYAGGDLASSFVGLGRAIGRAPSTSAGQAGKTLSIIGNAGTALLRGARAVLSGLASERLTAEEQRRYAEELRRTNEQSTAFLENGGKITKKENGGVIVEVENGEYLRDPQGNILEVEGNTHEQGGEIFNLQIGTEVTSNNSKIGRSGVNKINELFPNLNLNLKATDTYADVVRKSSNRIGVDKKQEQIDKTRNQLENLDRSDENTWTTNSIYLNDRLASEESELVILKDSQRIFLDSIFDLQESNKQRPTPNTDNFFKNGGKVKDEYISELVNKTKLPREYVHRWLMRKGGKINKYPDGGIVYQPVLNRYVLPEYNSQSFTNTGQPIQTSGNVSSDAINERVEESLRIFPAAAQFFNIERDSNGNISSIEFKSNDSVRAYQDYVNRVYSNIEDYADNYVSNEQQRQELKNYVSGLRFEPTDTNSVRFMDNIFGDFTSSRSGIALPLVTETELETLRGQGVTNFSQLFDENGRLTSIPLSDSTRSSLIGLRQRYGNDFEAQLLGIPEITSTQTQPENPNPVTQQQQSVQITPPNNNTNNGVGDYSPINSGNSGFNIPIFPNQYRYDFDSLQGAMLQEPRYGRMYARRINTDGVTSAAYNGIDAALRTTAGYADPQRLSVISDVIANQTVALNQSLTDIETQNIQNEQTVEQFNVVQGDREEDARLRERRLFEELTMTALAKTQKNNEIIDNHNSAVTLENFNSYNRLQNLNRLFPNYRVTNGVVEYDPTSSVPLVVMPNMGASSFALQQLASSQQRNQSVTNSNRR